MDNTFITDLLPSWRRRDSRKVARVNRWLERLGFYARMYTPGTDGDMTQTEHRATLYHLAEQVIAYGVEGDFVELGCYKGETSVLLKKILEVSESTKALHLFDAFEGRFEGFRSHSKEINTDQLTATFADAGLRVPSLHPGWFEDTLPDELPTNICFVSIDVGMTPGPGKAAEAHAQTIRRCLEAVYPRMSAGAICVLADYSEPTLCPVRTHYPGAKEACDDFFRDLPESMSLLWGPHWTQGYFRKLPSE